MALWRCFRLNGMTVNIMASSFTEGARMMIAPALLVGFAKGIPAGR
ncbi:hypothetical protein ACNKHK_15145 [Shigella flexneri]